jgi:hypothetical protein
LLLMLISTMCGLWRWRPESPKSRGSAPVQRAFFSHRSSTAPWVATPLQMIALPGVAGVTFVMSGREACGTVGSPFHMVLQYIVRQEKKRAHCKFLAKSLHIFIIDGRTPNRQSVSLFFSDYDPIMASSRISNLRAKIPRTATRIFRSLALGNEAACQSSSHCTIFCSFPRFPTADPLLLLRDLIFVPVIDLESSSCSRTSAAG